jgi:tripeptide aminopeptidase
MDTSPEASGANVDPKIVENYDGGDILLGGAKASDASGSASSDASARILSPKDFPELLKYKGQTLITSDGSTLLGADDKPGVAEIMTMLNYLIQHPQIPHGKICVAFTPDEEIGEGTLGFDIGRFGAEYAYTVDGGELGELSYENFNAASATIKITGRNVHPGEAFGKMIHAARLAMEIEAQLPPEERPEKTKDHQGVYHLTDISGDASQATMKYILRDHDQVLFEKKKETVREVCAKVESAHPGAKIEVEIKDSYFNMLEKIKPHFHVVERCREAMLRCGIEPRIEPIRGGTDGATLSFKGLPCPNICAGGHNFHGVYEYISCEAMAKITGLLVELARH